MDDKDKNKRCCQLNIRFTPKEIQDLHKNMNEAHIANVSAYVRKMALHGFCINIDTKDIKDLVYELNRIGNNLNQYAKKANETGCIYEIDIKELQNDFSKICSEVVDIEADYSELLSL